MKFVEAEFLPVTVMTMVCVPAVKDALPRVAVV